MKKMPTPVNDMVLAQQRNPEKTEAAIQRVGSISPHYVGETDIFIVTHIFLCSK